MKKILITGIWVIFLTGLFTACQEDEIDFYTGPAAINMSLDGDGTFVNGETNTEKTFQIRLAVQGENAAVPRTLRLAFGKEHTAVAGTNFELPMEIVWEPGRLDTVIDCKVYRAGLTEEPLMFNLVIDPEGDFVGGVYDELFVKFMIGYPTQWIDPTGWAAGYYLGECTQAKYKFVFEQLGTLDLGPWQGNWGSGYGELAKKLNKILEEAPRTDDNGKIMKFGSGY